MTRRSNRVTAIAMLALPAMLMLTAATTGPVPEKKKSNPAIWIALAAVFIGAGTSIFAAMTASRSKTAKQRSDSGDTAMADGGSDSSHHHSHDSGHSDGGGDGGGGADGGGGD